MIDDPVILAVSSAPGRGARGLVRASGPDLSPLIDVLLAPRPTARTLTLAALGLSHAPGPLPCLAVHFPGPGSFTGEHVLELQLPGNPVLLERTLDTIIAAAGSVGLDARLAEPGEFTRRAFLAGRIDLTRAEGIAATVTAETDAQLRAASLLRTGRLGRWAEGLVDRLADALALVEAGIDFTDQDDVVPITPAELDRRLAEIEAEMADMLDRGRSWAALEAVPWVVLVGRPNAGKSTLFNALLGADRAVISPVAGTTRDVLAEPMRIDPAGGEAAEVMLVDAAGLERADGALDRAMHEAARAAIDRAELLLDLRSPDVEPVDIAALAPPGVPVIRVLTKADLPAARALAPRPAELAVSARSGAGLDVLARRIGSIVGRRAVSVGGEMLALRPRHTDALQAARRAVADARAQLAGRCEDGAIGHVELVAGQMRAALDAVAALGGVMTPDDVIGRVFATFCIGK